MRAYIFTNFYLSSLAKGIQSAHALVDLGRKYTLLYNEANAMDTHLAAINGKQVYANWADNHKTVVVLNGGNSAALQVLIDMFVPLDVQFPSLGIPWCAFREDEESLNGALTAVAIIVNDEVVTIAEKLRRREIYITQGMLNIINDPTQVEWNEMIDNNTKIDLLRNDNYQTIVYQIEAKLLQIILMINMCPLAI